MKYFIEYLGHTYNVTGRKNLIDTTIYTLDIETTNYFIKNGNVCNSLDYDNLTEEEKEDVIPMSTMYIWMVGVNSEVYYGRTYKELYIFLNTIDLYVGKNIKKFMYIHNASFEFQFLKNFFDFNEVIARKAHKVMSFKFCDFNIEVRCSYILSNCSLDKLGNIYNLDLKKQIGSLDYYKIRHYKTPLTEQELKYCEYDCLVLYLYIKKELETYKELKNIPLTYTGHVRGELKNVINKDYAYKNYVKKSINKDPIIYNLLVKAFMRRIYAC